MNRVNVLVKSCPVPLMLVLASTACGSSPPELPTAATTTEATGTSATAPASTGADDATTSGGSAGSGTDTTGSPQTTGGGSSSSETGATILTEHLQNAPFATCSEPLWCFASSPNNPQGNPTHGQECFDAQVAPPYVVGSVTVHIAQLVDQLSDVDLVVYAPAGLAPTEPPIYVESVPVDALVEGANVIALSETVVVPTSRVCVGLRSNGFGLSGALGMAIDTQSQIPDVSYLSLMGLQACDIPELTEVIGLAPMPSGNWCISAEIESAPGN
jgi:hypothetical protein